MPDISARLEALVEETVAALGLDLEALELKNANGTQVLVVAVDTDGGVGIDEVTDATRALSQALDADDDLMGPQPYTLEVASRGVSRPLTLPRHWRRNEGRLVRARLLDGDDLTARIGASDDDGVTLGTGGAARRIAYSDVRKAVIQPELNPGKDV